MRKRIQNTIAIAALVIGSATALQAFELPWFPHPGGGPSGSSGSCGLFSGLPCPPKVQPPVLPPNPRPNPVPNRPH